MRSSTETVQPQIATITVHGVSIAVSVAVSYDGVEYVGRLWFADALDGTIAVPDRGVIPARSKEEVVALARRFTDDELAARYRRASSNKRRFLALRTTADEMLAKVRYLNQVAISMRAGLIDLEGAAQEIDLTEQQLHELIRRMREVAGVERDEA